MTASDLVLEDWATKPAGKAARIAIATGGLITATLVILMSTIMDDGAWLFTLLGVALAATSVRAARYPTIIRMAVVAANLIAVPLVAQAL
jgi:hypothetical protein